MYLDVPLSVYTYGGLVRKPAMLRQATLIKKIKQKNKKTKKNQVFPSYLAPALSVVPRELLSPHKMAEIRPSTQQQGGSGSEMISVCHSNPPDVPSSPLPASSSAICS